MSCRRPWQMLIRLADLKIETPDTGTDGQPDPVRVTGRARHVRGRAKVDLHQLIGQLQHDEHIHVPSKARWSMHDMLQYILEQTGPADVWITSWTITEQPVRTIVEHIDKGLIRSCRMLLSERVEAMNPAALQLAKGNLQVRLTKLHAKCIVVLNDTWGVTVGGSANMTRNPRIEMYIVSTHRAVAEADRAWIDEVFAGAHPFDE